MPKKKNEKTIEQIYQKMSQKEHIKKRPDTYVGDIKPQKLDMWIPNKDNTKMLQKTVKYVPGMYKVIDEIITNAGDRLTEDKKCDTVKISYSLNEDKTKLEISVFNNGKGIPIVEHNEYKIYVPTLVFGRLLSSSNFNDDEERKAGGRNGYGAKLANIFSTDFTIETVDDVNKKKLIQSWHQNMDIEDPPKVTSCKKGKSYTQVTFCIDINMFNIKKVSNDMLKMIDKRAFDLAATVGSNKKIYLNDKRIPINNFKKYVEMFMDNESKLVFDNFGNDWSVGVSYKPDQGFQQVSYVNGIATFKGGNHVKHVEDAIIKSLVAIMKKKSKDVKIKASHLKEHLSFFVNCMVVNPAFTSQTKEELKTLPEEFGTVCNISDAFIKKIQKTGLTDRVLQYVKIKESTFLKKSDGKKTQSVRGIDKLTDASWAGHKTKSKQCILILTEGDSAKGLAMAGREKVGNNVVGVFPLKGKLLNVRDAAPKKLADNEEIKNIKKILGLKQGEEYKSLDQLRYGRIMIFTDQDNDGFHIKGLVMNFIAYYWPSLVDLGFLTFLPTHIIRATKGNQIKDFMTISNYEKWKEENDSKGWHIKYYKGLGTSTRKDAKEYFTNLYDKLITYTWQGQLLSEDSDSDYIEVYSSAEQKDNTDLKTKCKKALDLAFEKSLADKRKEWLSTNISDKDIIQYDKPEINIHDFVHGELKLFSLDDNQRSIPASIDGLKPSLRKILYACLKKKCDSKRNEIKVAQLSGYVSEHTAYHHGEASLQGAIIGMAQDYVGKNNINLLFPNGSFGTRLEGGKDAASPRYIFTYLSSITKYLFRDEDIPVLKYLDDDGQKIEPEFYYPIIPTVLVNGGDGIGTGWSCEVPKYNIDDIIENIKNLLNNKKLKSLKPWYRNFTGTIKKDPNKDNSYEIYGKYKKINDTTLEITELPIGKWTLKYKTFLDSIIDIKENKTKLIKSYDNYSSDIKVHFILHFTEDKLNKLMNKENIYNELKLISKVKTSNMHLINNQGVVQKYKSPNDIIKSFYNNRMKKYEERKNYWCGKYKNDLDILKYKRRYIQFNIDKKIKVFGRKKDEVISRIEKLKFPRLTTSYPSSDKDKSYDYIIKLYHFDFTKEKIEELDKLIKNKQKELNTLLTTSEKDMWLKELDELQEHYQKWDQETKPIDDVVSKTKKKIKIKTKTKTKKKNKSV